MQHRFNSQRRHRLRRLGKLGVALGGLTVVLGCPGFGEVAGVDALGDVAPDAPACEQVQAVMAVHCNQCHSGTAREGAPGYFRTDTFLDTATVAGAATMSERLLARSSDGSMPPSGRISAAELEVLRAWHAAGAPVDACSGSAAPIPEHDAGTVHEDASPGADATPPPGPIDEIDTPKLADVVREVFAPSCNSAGCHGGATGASGLTLEGDGLRAHLLQPSPTVPQLPWVTPGDEDQSYLFLKVEGSHLDAGGFGLRMPVGVPLGDAQERLLRDWIRDGAPE